MCKEDNMQDISHIVAKVAARNYIPDDITEKIDQSEYDRLKEMLYQIGDNSVDYSISDANSELDENTETTFETINEMTDESEEDRKLQDLLDSTTVPNTTPTEEYYTETSVPFEEVFEKLLEHAANEEHSDDEATSDFITGSFGSLEDEYEESEYSEDLENSQDSDKQSLN